MNNKFSENLKKLRKENNLSQEQLADIVGVSRQAISKWESSQAYPEMDKIIILCEKFNVKIDDLLHKDIEETKGEIETKKKLNKYIDNFLNFITDTINMFANMSFKNKIKCILEQIILILILIFCSQIISDVIFNIINSLSILPNRIYHLISIVIESIYIILSFIITVIILVHTFKVRYLNYYNSEKKKKNLEIKEQKIIIRDPKHSDYNFITCLYKLILKLIKLLVIGIFIFLSFILIFTLILLVASFMLNKTGLLFIGLIGIMISFAVIVFILMLISFNFIFNRKTQKKENNMDNINFYNRTRNKLWYNIFRCT